MGYRFSRTRARGLSAAIVLSVGMTTVAFARDAFVRVASLTGVPSPGPTAVRVAFDGQLIAGHRFSFRTTAFYERDGSGWRLLQNVQGNVAGDHVSMDGSTVVIGGSAQGVPSGMVEVLERTGDSWQMQPAITPPDGSPDDEFGAWTALEADVLAIGAPGDDDVAGGSQTIRKGGVYIYGRVGGAWQLQAKLSSPNASANQAFGERLVLSGGLLVVAQDGSAYVYKRVLGAWTIIDTLSVAPDAPGARIIAIDHSGGQLAMQLDTQDVLLFTRSGDTWTRGPLVDVFLQDQPTDRPAIAIDDDTLWVLARSSGGPRIVAYVYRYETDGWYFRQRILTDGGDNPRPAIRGNTVVMGRDSLPAAVDVYEDLPVGDSILLGDSLRGAAGSSADGAGEPIAFADGLLLIGAPASANGKGEAYLFAFEPGANRAGDRAKAVQLVATLSVSGGNIGDKFGASLAITGNGETIAIGSPASTAGAGTVAVFRKPSSGWASTAIPDAVISAPTAPGITAGAFGGALAFDEADVLTVGAPETDRGATADAGIAATFVPSGGTYPATPNQLLMPPSGESNARFGDEVSSAGGVISIGAPNQDRVGPLPDAGAVHTFTALTVGQPFQAGPVLTSDGGGNVGDKFGRGVVVRNTGGTRPTIVIGAPGIDAETRQDTGAAMVYEDPGTGYLPVARLSTGGLAFDQAGTSIDVTATYVAIGAPRADRQFIADTGTAYVYRTPPGGWLAASQALAKSQGKVGYAVLDVMPTAELPPAEVQSNQFFGAALALGSREAFVSAPARDVQLANGGVATDQGAVDVYSFDEVFESGFE